MPNGQGGSRPMGNGKPMPNSQGGSGKPMGSGPMFKEGMPPMGSGSARVEPMLMLFCESQRARLVASGSRRLGRGLQAVSYKLDVERIPLADFLSTLGGMNVYGT